MNYEFGWKHDGFFNRNRWGSHRDVLRWANEAGRVDVFASVFGFTGEIKTDPVYGGLYFDLDSPELDLAYQDVNLLIAMFDNRDLSPQDYRVCFSGRKGFHVNVAPLAMDVTPANDLPRIYRKIADEVKAHLPNRTVDTQVYDRRRLWRLVNSRHSGSGLYKVALPLPLPSLPEVLNLAERPRPLPPKQPRRSVTAARWLVEVRDGLAEIVHHEPRNYGRQLSAQVQELLNGGTAEGNRNGTAFYLACYLRTKGYNESEIAGLLAEFASHCHPPLPAREIGTVIRSAMKR